MRPFAYQCLILTGVLAGAAAGTDRIANTKHDLSMFSPNAVRAVDEDRICIFCHAPHNTDPQTPLWNRHNPTTYYRIYRSSTTDARIDQPSGTSKMCLSCHDGSLAVGLVRSRPANDPIPMTVNTLPPGRANLTNDLSDDHPISFRYDRTLSNADPQIRDPQLISSRLSLGPHSEVQCTTCHDPHNNEWGDFLRITTRRGALCTSCHRMAGWQRGAHALSPRNIRARLVNVEDRPDYAGMSDYACLACHRIHGAEERERLLIYRRPESNCVTCHDGTVAEDIFSLVRLTSNHRGNWRLSRHDPAENPRTMPDHVECVDCHNPHAAREDLTRRRPGSLGLIASTLSDVPGVNVHGQNIPRARYEYEICLRCHGDNPVAGVTGIPRVRSTINLRRQISPTAASSHPFVVPSRSAEVPSLLPGLTGRRIDCSDCHNNPNARNFGGSGPNGPHGSVFDALLALRYESRTFVTETPQAYALCYRCHDRGSILADQSFSLHNRHIVRGRASCSACHDPHGVVGSRTSGSHLINFDRTIVEPVAGTGPITYRDRGRFQGSCTLRCHGVTHVNFIYSPTAGP